MVHGDNVVEVLVHISESGTVTTAKLGAVKGTSTGFLSKLAVSAAQNWQFRPATQNGKPVPSDKILEFLFRPSPR
jgi:TonB family protein